MITSSLKNSINFEIKLLKKRPIIEENTITAAVEDYANETPIEHNDNIESVKNSVNELEEASSAKSNSSNQHKFKNQLFLHSV